MSKDGFDRWGHLQKIHISKSRWVWKYYDSSRFQFPDGIPLEFLKTDREFGIFLINNYLLGTGETFSIQGWTHRKTRFGRGGRGVGFTKKIFEIEVHDVEKYAFTVKLSKLNNYWFRKQENKRKKQMWGE